MDNMVFIRVFKSKFELQLFEDDQVSQAYQVGVGANVGDKVAVGDKRTPEGVFKVVSIEDSSQWSHDFFDGKGVIDKAYGPWFIRLSTTSYETKARKTWIGIGIHGTHDPSSIGTLCTEGCIRMRNEDILQLVEKVVVGTPVEILP